MVSMSSPGKMVAGRSSTSASKTARTQIPITGRKVKKTRQQKDEHNKRCREFRKREREKVNNMTEELSKLRDENQRMMVEALTKVQDLKTALQQKEIALQKKAENETWMLQIISILTRSGQNFNSVDEFVEWFLLQNNGQVGGGSNQTNLSPYAGAAAVPSSVENHLLNSPIPNNINLFSGAPASGVAASAPNPGHCSSVPNPDLLFGFGDGNDNAFIDYVHANGFPSGGKPNF